MQKQKRSQYNEFFNHLGHLAECKLCLVQVPWTSKSGTSCLRYHLQKYHPHAFQIVEQKKEAKRAKTDDNLGTSSLPNEESVFDDDPSFYENGDEFSTMELKPTLEELSFPSFYLPETNTPTSSSDPKLDMLITKMIVRDGLPFEMVRKRGFLEFTKHMSPDYEVPNTEFFVSIMLPALSEEIQKEVINNLEKMEFVSFSIDEWQKEDIGLISVRAHWVDMSTFEWRNCVVGTQSFDHPLTLEEKRDVITKALNQFKIYTSQVKCVVGNASNSGMCKDVPYIECFSQKIDSCVRDLLRIDSLFGIMTQLAPDSLGSEFGEDVLSNELNWKLIYKMSSFLLTNKEKNNNESRFQIDQWKTIQETFNILHVFASLVKVENEQFVSASIIIPAIKVIGHKLTTIGGSEDQSEQEKEWARKLIDSFSEQTRLYEENELLKLCTFLDPRFQNSFFKDDFSPEIVRILREQAGEVELIEDVKPETIVSDFEIYLQKTGKLSVTKKPADKFEKEVNEYLDSVRDCSTDPFQYWGQHTEMPNLRTLALSILSIPAETSKNAQAVFRHSKKVAVHGREKLAEISFCKESLES